MTAPGVRSRPSLPVFVSPMLAQKGQPFDSEAHLFEIKWDGTRMLAFVEGDGYRLVNRHRAERTAQYPELACLAELPAGVILDGEVVVLHEGRPDFGRLLSHDQAGSPLKIRLLARSMPAMYRRRRKCGCSSRSNEEGKSKSQNSRHSRETTVF